MVLTSRRMRLRRRLGRWVSRVDLYPRPEIALALVAVVFGTDRTSTRRNSSHYCPPLPLPAPLPIVTILQSLTPEDWAATPAGEKPLTPQPGICCNRQSR